MTPAKENSVIEIQCNMDAEYAFCQFQHLGPMEEEVSSQIVFSLSFKHHLRKFIAVSLEEITYQKPALMIQILP